MSTYRSFFMTESDMTTDARIEPITGAGSFGAIPASPFPPEEEINATPEEVVQEDEIAETVAEETHETQPVQMPVNENKTLEEKLQQLTTVRGSDSSPKLGTVQHRMTVGRIYDKDVTVRRRISNRAVSKVINEYRHNHAMPTEVEVRGVTLRGKGAYGLWEEGGSDAEMGSVLLATGKNGEKLPPVVVSFTPNMYNGKHALLSVDVGCYLFLGGQRRRDMVLGIYRIDDISIPNTTSDAPFYNCSLVAYYAEGRFVKVQDNPFHENADAVLAAKNRMLEEDADTPAYVCDYVEHFFSSTDYKDWSADKEALASYTEETSVTAVYDKANRILGDAAARINNRERAILIIVFNLQDDGEVYAYFLGGVYNLDTGTSKGNRMLYCRVRITADTNFYYPDKENIPENYLSADVIKSVITKSTSSRAIVFRRMTTAHN